MPCTKSMMYSRHNAGRYITTAHQVASLGLAALITLMAPGDTRGEERECLSHSGGSNPSCATYYSDIAEGHVRKHEYDLAIKALTEAIRRDPKLSTAILRRAHVYAAKGDDDLALLDFNVAITGGGGPLPRPQSTWAYYARGLIFLKRGQYDRSLSDFNAAVQADRTFKEAYHARAEALLRQGRLTEALADANRALWVAPPYAAGFAMRARIYEALGRRTDAIADNAYAGALFVPSASGILRAELYQSSRAECTEDAKHLVQITIAAGKVAVQPLYVGTEGKIAVRQNSEGMMLRLGNEGCRVDVEIGKGINEAGNSKGIASELENVDLALTNEPPSYVRTVYQEPSPACADTKLTIRAYWGFVELRDNYEPPRGRGRTLGLSRQYGSEGCKIDVRVSKVD